MQDIIIQLITGAIGGNAAGALMKNKSLGGIGNTIAGLLGGAGGGQLLSALGLFGEDAGGMLGNVAGSGVGGAVLMLVIGFIKKAMAKSS